MASSQTASVKERREGEKFGPGGADLREGPFCVRGGQSPATSGPRQVLRMRFRLGGAAESRGFGRQQVDLIQ